LKDGEPRFLREKRSREMPGAAGARMRHRGGRALQVGNELAQRIGRERLAPDEDQRIAVDERYGCQLLLGVVGKLRIERDVGGDLQVVQEQRIAVRRGARDAARSDRGAAAAHVLDNEALSELL